MRKAGAFYWSAFGANKRLARHRADARASLARAPGVGPNDAVNVAQLQAAIDTLGDLDYETRTSAARTSRR